MSTFEFTELVPNLPEELALECLTRLDYTAHKFASSVCSKWRNLLNSREFYYHRKKSGSITKAACLVQSFPGQIGPDSGKPADPVKYGISLFDPVKKSWDRVEPVPKYPDGLPLFCQVASTEGKLVVLGGWDPVSYEPITDVFVYDFLSGNWRKGENMPSKRSFFASVADSGRVFVAGGHDENKNALASSWVYDIRLNKWSELAIMGEERDECYGVLTGSGFLVVSGYGTENQGSFKNSAEFYDFVSGKWVKIDDVWGPSTCPRSNVGLNGKDGKLFSWSDLDEAIRVGTCGVDLDDRVLVSGSGYQGGPHGFYVMEIKGDGTRGKLVKFDVPDEFSGFVQTGCCVEI